MHFARTALLLAAWAAAAPVDPEPSTEPVASTSTVANAIANASAPAIATDEETSTMSMPPIPPASTLVRTSGPEIPTSSSASESGPALITNTASIANVPAASFGPGKVVTLPESGASTTEAPTTSTSNASSTATKSQTSSSEVGATLTFNPSASPVPTASLVTADSPSTSGTAKHDYNASNLPYHINAPGGSDQWWVLDATNYLFATPPSDHNLRVGLTNADPNMLSTYDGWWDLGGFDCKTGQDPPVCIIAITDLGQAAPGSGYMLYLTRADDPLKIIGVSDPFDIQPAGSKPPGKFSITVKNNSASVSSTPQWTVGSAMGESGSTTSTSAGWHDSPALRLVAACVAVVLAAV